MRAITLLTALPALPVAVPLLFAALSAGLRPWISRRTVDSLAITAAVLHVLLCARLLALVLRHGPIVSWFGNWTPRGTVAVGICFVIDTPAAALALLAGSLALLAFLFAWRSVDSGSNHFQPLTLVFLAAMSGFALSGDLFNLFVFFELMSTAAFALCGLKTREPAPLQGAFNFAVTNTVAAFMILTGIGLLYAMTGALNLAQIGYAVGSRHDPLVLFAATLITAGFLVKAAIIPFHLWLPDAHAVAPTPVCVLFSGIMVELGLYAILRLHTVLFAASFAAHGGRLRTILLIAGAFTAVAGGVMCYAEHHLKRLLAFSTVSHAGLMLLALALRTPLAIAGMLLYLVAHAFIKSGLFFCTGIVLHRLRSIGEASLFGRGRELRITRLLWLLGGIGLAGSPPFATTIAESLTSHGASAISGTAEVLVAVAFVASGVLTGGAVLRTGMRLFLGWGDGSITDEAAEVGERPETPDASTELCWYHVIPPVVCALAAITLFALPLLVPAFREALLRATTLLLDQRRYVYLVLGEAAGRQPDSAGILPAWPAARVVASAGVRGLLTALAALLLALSSVFRLRLPRAARMGAFLEGPLRPLRALQSGHPGDYVLWVVTGTALLGVSFLFALRS